MLERKIVGSYEDVLHKVKVAANNIGFFSFGSEEKIEKHGDITIHLLNISRKNEYLIFSYYETLSIMIVADENNITLTAIGGGGNKGVKLEKDFEMNFDYESKVCYMDVT